MLVPLISIPMIAILAVAALTVHWPYFSTAWMATASSNRSRSPFMPRFSSS
jgi:hypothetical protein